MKSLWTLNKNEKRSSLELKYRVFDYPAYIHKKQANDFQYYMKYTSDNVSRLSINTYLYVYLITIHIIHNCSRNYFNNMTTFPPMQTLMIMKAFVC